MIVPIILLFLPQVLSLILNWFNLLVTTITELLTIPMDFVISFTYIFDFISSYIGWFVDFLLVPIPVIVGYLTFGLWILSLHLAMNIIKIGLKLLHELFEVLPG